MWNFLKSLLSNRLGIVLATLNVCGLLYHFHYYNGDWTLPAKMIALINTPSAFLTKLSTEFISLLFQSVSFVTLIQIKILLFGGFVVFQWLLIAWLAKEIAQKITEYEIESVV